MIRGVFLNQQILPGLLGSLFPLKSYSPDPSPQKTDNRASISRDTLDLRPIQPQIPSPTALFDAPSDSSKYTIQINDFRTYPQGTNFASLQSLMNNGESLSRSLVTKSNQFEQFLQAVYPGSRILSGGGSQLNAVLQTAQGDVLKIESHTSPGIMLQLSSIDVVKLKANEVPSFLNSQSVPASIYLHDLAQYPSGADLNQIRQLMKPHSQAPQGAVLNVDRVVGGNDTFHEFLHAVFPKATIYTKSSSVMLLMMKQNNTDPTILKMPNGEYFKAEIPDMGGCMVGLPGNNLELTKLSEAEVKEFFDRKPPTYHSPGFLFTQTDPN